MSLFTDPPRVSKTSFRKGDTHLGVWALQRLLNTVYAGKLPAPTLVEDGFFGSATEETIKRYQSDTQAAVDGIVGPQTQERMVRSCIVRAAHGTSLPKGLAEGQIDGESGRYLAAVNSQIPGGLDLGLTQRRVYGPPFIEQDVMTAMDPIASVSISVNEIYTHYTQFRALRPLTESLEYSWRLAMLAHNWPWGAQELSHGRALSATRAATWVPANVKFADGAPVKSFADWARFYAMGSHTHNHAGLVTKLAFGVPSWG